MVVSNLLDVGTRGKVESIMTMNLILSDREDGFSLQKSKTQREMQA